MKPRPPGALSFRRYLPRHSLAAGGLWASLLLLVLLGCGRSTASQDDPAAEPLPGSTLSVPLAARLKSVPSCDTDLLARVIVDGNESNPIGLFVDCTAGTVSGTISGLSPGSHTFELRFTLLDDVPREILIATAVTTGDIASAQNTPIAFGPGSLVFPDDDHDGWTNLAEVIAGTDYLLAADAPESSARRKSANYAIADSVGLAPAVGPASGGRYTDSLGRGPINR